MFSFLLFSPSGGLSILRMNPVESGLDDSRRRCAHLNSAGAAQIRHGANPGNLDIVSLAKGLQGAGKAGIGIFCQKNTPGTAGADCLAQLLAAHDQLSAAEIGQFAAVRYSTIVFPIHTDTYYTQYFEKVNKIIRIIFVIVLISVPV